MLRKEAKEKARKTGKGRKRKLERTERVRKKEKGGALKTTHIQVHFVTSGYN